MEVPKTVSQDRIQQRNVEQIVDVPVPQVVEELVEVFKVSTPKTGLNSRSVESDQSKLLLPFHSLRRSLRCLSLRREKRRDRLRTRMLQHVGNTVEVEIPQIGAETGDESVRER